MVITTPEDISCVIFAFEFSRGFTVSRGLGRLSLWNVIRSLLQETHKRQSFQILFRSGRRLLNSFRLSKYAYQFGQGMSFCHSEIMKLLVVGLFLALLSSTQGHSIQQDPNSPPSTLSHRQISSCENTATSRQCWGDYNIDTDYYNVTPDTGETREVIGIIRSVNEFFLDVHFLMKVSWFSIGSKRRTSVWHLMDTNVRYSSSMAVCLDLP